jgi:hypothetical protein
MCWVADCRAMSRFLAKLAERLPVLLTEKVKQLSARRVTQRFENLVSVHRSHSNVRPQYAGKYLHVKWPATRPFRSMRALPHQ